MKKRLVFQIVLPREKGRITIFLGWGEDWETARRASEISSPGLAQAFERGGHDPLSFVGFEVTDEQL